MIKAINIKNVALIKELSIDFSKNLNILSGETGAGKSIIIDSINFCMGGKAGSDFVRRGEEMATVNIMLRINSDITLSFLEDNNIPIVEDNLILINRSLSSSGKSNLRINGKVVTISVLKELSSQFIDIHGQFEHQFLLNEKQHINLLDKFCPDKLQTLKIDLSNSIEEYKKINLEISIIESQTSDLDNLTEEMKEIEALSLKSGEEDEVLAKIKYLANFREISENISKAIFLMYPEDGARSRVLRATRYIRNIEEMIDVNDIIESLENVGLQIEDINNNLKHRATDFDQKQLEQLEERLATIHSAKRLYRRDIDDIILLGEELKQKISDIENKSFILEGLKNKRKEFKNSIVEFCNRITDLRISAKELLEKEIISNLQDLGMKNVNFSAELTKKSTFGTNGNDNVRFLISANIGEPLKPLAKIASGGEMSRVMLSLKIVLSQGNSVESFIFDEIDTGVSGRAAQLVANKLHDFSQHKQILCITHLPQIAAMADSHFLIEKTSEEYETITNINFLADDEITNEIARLIGGARITETTMKAAKEMKELANKQKTES